MRLEVSVTELAEFVHRRGDLFPPLEGRTRAEEGVAAQRKVQANRAASYVREYSVKALIEIAGMQIAVSGRVDGYDPAAAEVEEIKTTRADPEQAEAYLGSVHWAQLELYAALLTLEGSAPELNLVLSYCHPETLAVRQFRRVREREALASMLDDTLARFAAWHRDQAAHVQRRNAWLEAREFPFPAFRRHQRAMAHRVFRAFRDHEHLLLEAPTGSGKTLGILYPACKALAAGHTDRLFYLTSRTTGRRAARAACKALASGAPALRYVEIQAKESACPVPGTPCRSDRCEYARGYYDRRHGAVMALLERAAMDSEVVGEVAAAHRVCPFELSLDAASWADVIIGDYNYLLDPVVRLQRFADDARLGVLVDEAHQLSDRARDMLSLTISRTALRQALGESPPAALARRLKAVDRQLVALAPAETIGEREISLPEPLLRSMARCLEAFAEEDPDLDALPACRELLFNLSRWGRAEGWLDDGFRFFVATAPAQGRRAREAAVRLACLDPGPYLARVLGGYGPHVRFSGTVSPLPLYQRLHGLPEASAERVASLFAPEQLGLFVVPDLSVLYRHRAATLPALVELVVAVASSTAGNYLVAVPSFAYLDALEEALRATALEPRIAAQTRTMDAGVREGFLARFTAGSELIGLVVLGGIFAESVDFSAAVLKGVVCVGVGVPPADVVRDSLARHFDDNGAADGATVAYQQPAMCKVLQMAGRLLRGPEDRGIVCLVDARFRDPAYQRFFPSHWRPRTVNRAALAGVLENFWQAPDPFPRLAHSPGS